MRRLAIIIPFLCLPSTVFAGENGGSSGGGGRLGQVSGGMRTGGSSGGGGSRTEGADGNRGTTVVYVEDTVVGAGSVVATARPIRYDGGPAKVEVYLAAQKVVDSDGSWTAEVGIRDGLFRLGGSITRYYERQADDSQLTLTIPTLIGGVRVDDGGPTRVYLELGAAGAKTRNDPVMDSSVAGAIGGVRVEHQLTRGTSVTTEIHEMLFEDGLRAHSVRIGLRSGIVQASFRVLDFNVGPALYGPEIGLKF